MFVFSYNMHHNLYKTLSVTVDFLVKEDLLEIAKFCGRCHWKNAKGINCNQRVKWEMENYQMTEIEAKRANIKHCEKNSDTCRYDGDQC